MVCCMVFVGLNVHCAHQFWHMAFFALAKHKVKCYSNVLAMADHHDDEYIKAQLSTCWRPIGGCIPVCVEQPEGIRSKQQCNSSRANKHQQCSNCEKLGHPNYPSAAAHTRCAASWSHAPHTRPCAMGHPHHPQHNKQKQQQAQASTKRSDCCCCRRRTKQSKGCCNSK